MSVFGNDALLWYNVQQPNGVDWGELGLAIPNYGNDERSQNDTIRYLCSVVGRNLQAVMFHSDSRLRTPPSINTLTRIHMLCTRGRSILFGRAVDPATPNLESAHSLPAPEDFVVFPTPYFKVRNEWLKQYAGLILLALTDAFQDQENAKPIEISKAFAGRIGQYFQRVYRLMTSELFKVPLEEASKPDFTLSAEQLASYDPTKWFTSTEMVDTVPEFAAMPTEDDLRVLTNGIPVSQLPILGPYPTSAALGTVNAATTANPTGESFIQPPSA